MPTLARLSLAAIPEAIFSRNQGTAISFTERSGRKLAADFLPLLSTENP
jgi:hypothetical protein